MQRRHAIMLAVSLAFFFVTATTFTSLAVVLYTMVGQLHWSQAAAGFSFSLLGLACGLSSPLPALTMKWIGSRWTMCIGALVLAAGFALASVSQGIGLFFFSTSLMGVGFTLLAPAPAVYLLANWFPHNCARMMGYYFMIGAFGGVVGPPAVRAIVALSGDWQTYWRIIAAAAVVLAVVCLACVRDVARIRSVEEVRNAGASLEPQAQVPAPTAWTVPQALSSRQFAVIALAMMVVQTVVTTMHSTLVTQLTFVNASQTAGALAMSMLALSGTITKGVAGRIAERRDSRGLLILGLSLQCVGFVLLAAVPTAWAAFVFALLFGVGWGLSWLCAHVLILRYFGSAISGTMVAMATMMTTVAVVGPWAAGVVADHLGRYTPLYAVFAGLLALVTLSTWLFLRPPQTRDDQVRERAEDPPAAPDAAPLRLASGVE
ncbi:CynX/NimT family MFS transporter [Pseudoxanthomonas winnipegensis]|uniref:MFS transporter n=1 Tax=Pseudoxanthomonas winnipegensis TaxID=2480810 RepID=A0A4Q8LMG1_9GAMM|nr:MFS transporter [Pseudoxanthomonas winnipegensis]RZZ86275.1 MFS transporter [Pseudoxanthomonas winnipegensis]TAA31412.1 MFS transporter [Pseudoxanthomonas winnipegensis]TAA41291.1 MFS transporter [Pseudoxanthomonas winnipegensis]TBV77208.1 MFS transporter [Pseudoxanthomonas winnipegensis]